MMIPRLQIDRLSFLRREGDQNANLNFSPSFSFIYGASNTGKSFAVKSLDFMLGGSRELPAIPERQPYNRIILDVHLPLGHPVKLERAMGGGDFRIHDSRNSRTLGARHNKDSDDNLSNFLLGILNIQNKEIAKDRSGTKRPLSFRDIVRSIVADETAIQSEISPALSGDVALGPIERNVFKFLITGEDDSALISQIKPKDFRTSRTAQIQILEGMIAELTAELADGYPDAEKLEDELDQIQDELGQLEREIEMARTSVRDKLEKKKQFSEIISRDQARISDMSIMLENFNQLSKVYRSDAIRLEAIEEAAFLLSLDADDVCSVCGAPAEAQTQEHGLVDIEKARGAAEVEIAKIRIFQDDLALTVAGTTSELERTGRRLLKSKSSLEQVETELQTILPDAEEQQRRLSEIIPLRDRVRRGLELKSRCKNLEKQRDRIRAEKPVRRPTNFQAGLSQHRAQEFAAEVRTVLTAWGFPGEKRVFFDIEKTFDLVIDGKARKDNGKGVRAITHAAFKVAMLTFCRARNLPHPGFLILDTPLITYRDPMHSRGGVLEADEQAIRQSDLKERMFAHLGSLAQVGQIIIFDNADPPNNAFDHAWVEAFTNDSEAGRQGLL